MKKRVERRDETRKETKSPVSTDTHTAPSVQHEGTSPNSSGKYGTQTPYARLTHSTHTHTAHSAHQQSTLNHGYHVERYIIYAVVQVDYANDNSLLTFGLHLLRSSPSLTFLFASVCAGVNSLFFVFHLSVCL